MSNPQNVRTVADSPEAAPGATTTFVRADPRPSAEGYADLHPQLRAQLRELQLRTGTATPDVGLLVRLVNDHLRGAPGAAAERQTPAGARQHRRHLRAQACRAHGQRRAQSVRAGDPQLPAPRGAGV